MSQMFLNVVSTFKNDGIQAATRQLGAFGKQTSSFGSILGKVGTALAAFGVATKAVQFGRESITAARDLERNLFALDTIFGDLSPTMREFAKDAENIGLSQSKAAKASTFIGSVLKQSGFAMSDVSKETKNLVTLGTDLAALYGYDVQEALLGMTALFRGEYDPIEKFGVAMKQNEINSELAARGQDKLQGAARRNAEQVIRLELLYQRANDAMGAFTGQSGSLYTEQKKLGATFENMQAQLGTALLPAIVDVNEQLRLMLVEATPGLIDMFNVFADGLEALVGIFRDSMDPTTELGESFAAMGIQFNSLWNTLFGKDFNIAQIFEVGAIALNIFIDLIHDLMRFVEHTVIGFQVLGEYLEALRTFDFEKAFGTDWAGEIRNRIQLSDATKDFKLQSETASDAVKKLREEVANADEAKLDKITERLNKLGITAGYAANEARRFAMMAGYTPPDGDGPPPPPNTGTTTTTTGSAAKQQGPSGFAAVVQDMKFQGKKAEKQAVLLGRGLSKGLVNQILTTSKPIVAANQAIKATTNNAGKVAKKAVNNLNSIFNNQISEVNRRADEASAAASQAADAARAQAAELLRAEEARIDGLNQLYDNFLETIKGTFAQIRNAIQGAFDITGLGGSTNAILRNMDKLLTRLRSFSANVKSLATMGLDPALLQQIITAGPMAGARVASALVAGGAEALSAINAGYGQVGSLASEIATTGVQSLFDTQKQQSVYNITVTGGVGSGSTIGKAIVDAIKDYERTSGAVWQGA